jgi:dipeptidyl aminopeptidase/acylaminoacyl peptidase
MLSLEVPLLLIQGGADSNAPILNSDYAMIAFLSEGRTNLDYWVYPNLDHFFRDVTVDPTLPEADRSEEVWDRVWRWISADE